MKFDFNSVQIESVDYEVRGKLSSEYLGIKSLLERTLAGQSFAIPNKFRSKLNYCYRTDFPQYKIKVVKAGDFLRVYRLI